MKELLFGWITKPYIQWNFLDNIFCYLEIGLAFILIVIIYVEISELKDKKRKWLSYLGGRLYGIMGEKSR